MEIREDAKDTVQLKWLTREVEVRHNERLI